MHPFPWKLIHVTQPHLKTITVGPLHPWVPHSRVHPTSNQRYFGGKNYKKFQKSKLEFAEH